MSYDENLKRLRELERDFLSPLEDFAVAKDWNGDEIYEGEEVYIVGDCYVRDDVDALSEYFDSHYEKLVVGNGSIWN